MSKYFPRLSDSRESQNSSEQQNKQQPRAALINNKSSIFSLPPVANFELPNSSVVRQRVSAKDCLAAATVAAGASLPLMIGGRSKCVLNLVNNNNQHQPQPQLQHQNQNQQQQQQQPQAQPQQPSNNPSGPQNTALRAEQRRQNMVSVVRPVMSLAPAAGARQMTTEDFGTLNKSINSNLDDIIWSSELAREVASVSRSSSGRSGGGSSIMDDFLRLDCRVSRGLKSIQATTSTTASDLNGNEDFLLFGGHSSKKPTTAMMMMQDEFSEQNARQQLILFRREEFELNRNVRRQHKFMVSKIDERKRYLQIIHSVWAHKGFKAAVEKLVDIYQCGLVFTSDEGANSQQHQLQDSSNMIWPTNMNNDTTNKQRLALSSLQTPLVVDVIGMIVLRPKLWNLEICQLVLPIIVNDLLGQSTKYENYIEVAIKSLKLILSYFSPVIKSTLEASGSRNLTSGSSLNGPAGSNQPRTAASAAAAISNQPYHRGPLGVDLTQEDRLAKCLNCYKLLLEAQCLISKRCSSLSLSSRENPTCARLLPMFRELNQSLVSFIHSLAAAATTAS